MRAVFISFLILASCASRSKVAEDYSTSTRNTEVKTSRKTTVLFLIDGLSVSALKNGFEKRKLPHLERFFLSRAREFRRAHSIFPSLTFPNIAGLLREEPAHITNAIGNSVIVKSELLRFESGFDRERFGALMKEPTIFSRLREKGERSVSFDYGLGVSATSSSDIVDLKGGLALETMDYAYLDQKRLDGLKILLEEYKPAEWPSFIFVHLIGLDFASHHYGPDSKEARAVLSDLDRRMGPVLEELLAAEANGYQVATLLTADHGFARHVRTRYRIDAPIRKIDPVLRVLNEGRMAAVYSMETPTNRQLEDWSSKLLHLRGVETVTYRFESEVRIRTATKELRFNYQSVLACANASLAIAVSDLPATCPENLPPSVRDQFGPFFIPNVASYFQARMHPDLVVIPDERTGFQTNEIGFHGGITDDEVFVPVLLRNASLASDRTPALWELLRFMN